MALNGVPPGIVGSPFKDDVNNTATQSLNVGAQNPINPPIGVFGEFPGMTPKYARNTGTTTPDFRETMARLFVQVGPNEYTQFVKSVSADDPSSEPLVRVLAGTNAAVGGNNGGAGYIDFILEHAQHALQEKVEVVENLADNYVAYFFGQAAPTFSYSGKLINTVQDDQAMNMLRLYRNVIRGSQLARRKKLVRLRYDGLVVSGAAINFSWDLTSDNEMVVPFSFQILVKTITVLPNKNFGLVVLTQNFADAAAQASGQASNQSDTGNASTTSPRQLTIAPPVKKATALATLISSVNLHL